MKLLTINVHSWLETKQLEKMDELAKVIARENYDIIALQEVSQEMKSKIVYEDIKEDNFGLLLTEKIKKYTDTSYNYYWTNSHIGYDRLDEGLSFLTKCPVKSVDSFYCTTSTTIHSISSRKIMKLELENIDAEFYCCHMNLPTAEDENIYDNIKNILERTPTDKVKILMGDFNTDAINDNTSYENILKLGLYDTYNLAEKKDDGITVYKNISGWDNVHGKKRLDYIFTTEKVEVSYSKVMFNGKNEKIISDHNGVEIEIKL